MCIAARSITTSIVLGLPLFTVSSCDGAKSGRPLGAHRARRQLGLLGRGLSVRRPVPRAGRAARRGTSAGSAVFGCSGVRPARAICWTASVDIAMPPKGRIAGRQGRSRRAAAVDLPALARDDGRCRRARVDFSLVMRTLDALGIVLWAEDENSAGTRPDDALPFNAVRIADVLAAHRGEGAVD